jgi:hypothetical protein
MDNGTIALMISIFALVIPIIAFWHQHQRTIEQISAGRPAFSSAQVAACADALEKWIRLFDGMVAGKGYDAASVIEVLRKHGRFKSRSTAQ